MMNTKLTPRVGIGSLSSPLEVGADRAPAAADALASRVATSGAETVRLGPVTTPDLAVAAGRKLAESHVDAVALAATSWYEDYLVLDLLEECRVPVLLWSLPGVQTGALCGSQQLTCYLKQLNVPYACVFGAIEPGENADHAGSFLRAAALHRRLRRARVGLAGHRVAGMTEVAVNEIALKKALGPRVVPLDLPGLLRRAAEISDETARPLWRRLLAAAGTCAVPEPHGLESMKVYLAIKELVDQFRLDALAVGCYPHLMGKVCMAASLLADQGVPLACEGDVNGAVAQLLLTWLTNAPTHNTDWLESVDGETIILTHCGSGSFTLAEDPAHIRLDSVRLMGQGVCALFPARPGPVTLVNLLPSGTGYQCGVLEGQAVSTEMVFPGNPLRVRFPLTPPELTDWIHTQGLGHHWMAGYGHVAQELRRWAAICGRDLSLVTIPTWK